MPTTSTISPEILVWVQEDMFSLAAEAHFFSEDETLHQTGFLLQGIVMQERRDPEADQLDAALLNENIELLHFLPTKVEVADGHTMITGNLTLHPTYAREPVISEAVVMDVVRSQVTEREVGRIVLPTTQV